MAVHPATDTIAAIATAPGTGGIGIIRLSGPEALSLLRSHFLPYKSSTAYTSHRLYYGTVITARGQVLDEGGGAGKGGAPYKTTPRRRGI